MSYSSNNLIAPHGGYRQLKSFQSAEIVFDLTVEFCNAFLADHKTNKSYKSYRTYDQMVQAARSGSRNIAEGSQTSGTSKQSEIRLLDVARASLEELLADYIAFLRQNSLPLWRKDEPRAREARALGYKTDRTHLTYMSYMIDAETAANCLICLISQANYLLDQQIKSLGQDFLRRGDFKDRYRSAQREEIMNPIRPIGPMDPDYQKFLKEQGLRSLKNGQVVSLDDPREE